MLTVNGKEIEWIEGISFATILKEIGFTAENPRIIVRVNGTALSKKARINLEIKDSMDIQIINTLCGG